LKLFSLSVRGELVEPQKNTFARSSYIKIKKEDPLPLLLGGKNEKAISCSDRLGVGSVSMRPAFFP
jgi:hypothetical protein